MNKILSILFIVLALASCSKFSMHRKALQKVNFIAVDSRALTVLQDASCTISSDDGSSFEMKKNPEGFDIGNSLTRLTVMCSAPGYQQTALAITNSINQLSTTSMKQLPSYTVKAIKGEVNQFPANIVILLTKIDPSKDAALINQHYRQAYQDDVFFQGKTVPDELEQRN